MKEDDAKKVCNKILWYGLGLPYVIVIALAFVVMLFNLHAGTITIVLSTYIAVIVGILEISGCLVYKTYRRLNKKNKEAKI